MELIEILLSVTGGLITIVVGWTTWTIRNLLGRVNQLERGCISYDQMEKYVELKQAPLYVLLERMAEDIHQLRRLMERQYEQEKQNPRS